MTKAIFKLDGELRINFGKGSSRRLRRTQDKIPAIIYSKNQQTIPIILDHNKILQTICNKSFYTNIITLCINEKKYSVLFKEIQRHPYKKTILHIDFILIKETDNINIKIPLNFVNNNKSPAIKAGGIILQKIKSISITCNVKNIPKLINIDLSNIKLNQIIYLYDIILQKNIKISKLNKSNFPVFSINLPRATKVNEETNTKESKKQD